MPTHVDSGSPLARKIYGAGTFSEMRRRKLGLELSNSAAPMQGGEGQGAWHKDYSQQQHTELNIHDVSEEKMAHGHKAGMTAPIGGAKVGDSRGNAGGTVSTMPQERMAGKKRTRTGSYDPNLATLKQPGHRDMATITPGADAVENRKEIHATASPGPGGSASYKHSYMNPGSKGSTHSARAKGNARYLNRSGGRSKKMKMSYGLDY